MRTAFEDDGGALFGMVRVRIIPEVLPPLVVPNEQAMLALVRASRKPGLVKVTKPKVRDAK